MKLPPSGIRRILPKRIWQQIFFILVLFVIIPLVILGFFLLRTSQDAIKTTILRDHKEIAIHATGEIREHIKGAQGTLFMTASILGTLHADPWQQETAVVELSLKKPAFQRISSLNLDGDEIATSQLGTELRNRSKEEVFQYALSGNPYLSEVKISENHIPFLTIAEPIVQLGKVKGVLVADLNVRSVWDIVDAIQIGHFGNAYLIDHQGRIIAHQDKKKVLKNAGLSHEQVVRDVLFGKTGNLDEVDENGEPWLTSYAPIEKLNWGLIITQPESEAFAFSKKMSTQFLIIIALSILAALSISLILAHYMSRPIQDVIEGTRRISRGDFSHFFRIRSRSEIDQLLFSFNRMTRKLRKAQEDAKLSTIGKASTAIAHELKNSLQLIDTFIKLLPERQGDKQFIKEFADTIPQELDSWNTSLKNMMTFSRDSRFPTHELNINEIVQEIILLARLKARQLGIHLDVDLQDSLPMIMGNEEKLKQVLLNIVTNALEATPNDGKIFLSTKSFNNVDSGDSGSIKIEIMNTGEGIEENKMNKIFEPFYTTKSGGLGLGLSISKEIIDYHKGRIDVVNRDNNATSFIIQIPAIKAVLKRNAQGHSHSN